MTKPVFLVIPEWQGSPSSRAMQIAEGAEFLRGDLPQAARRDVAVPRAAGDAMGTPVARLSSLLRARDAALEALAEIDTASQVPIIVGGDGSSSLPGIAAAVREYGADQVALVWFDAHAGLQDPSTSPSGAASGMTLRHALGEGAEDLAIDPALSPAMVTLVGARDVDEDEEGEVARLGIARLACHDDAFAASSDGAALAELQELAESRPAEGGEQAGAWPAAADPDAAPTTRVEPDPEALAQHVTAALAASGASRVYVHVNLSVLDPSEIDAVHRPVPFGLTVGELTAAIRAAVRALPLAGAALSEFAPANEAAAAEDQPTVLRVIAALTSGLQS